MRLAQLITYKLVATRFGTGKKTKHVQLRFLYLQELASAGLLKMRKVNTLHNTADVLTKHVTVIALHRHLTGLGVTPLRQHVLDQFSYEDYV